MVGCTGRHSCLRRAHFLTITTITTAFISIAYLIFIPITGKKSNRYNELAEGLPAICQPHEDGEISLSAIANGTSKLASWFSTLSLYCRASSREAVKVIGLT